jgi:membrane-associated phospholipid phosphatase
MLNVWLSEIILFCYFCYYSMIPAFVLAVFLKRDYRELRIGLTAICLTFFLSYPLFFLYPIEGPRWYFADLYVNAIDGPVFVEFVHTVMRHGAVRGGCMPSTHTGVALAIMMVCFKYYRPVGWVMLPINVGLAIGTFWGRFHYVTDVFVGGAIAVFATMMVLKYYDRWERPPVNAERSTEMRIHHAA